MMNELDQTSALSLAPDADLAAGAAEPGIETTPMQETLALFITRCYNDNAQFARELGHHAKMREDQRVCQAENDAYEQSRLAELNLPLSTFDPITEIKRQAAVSQLKDIWNSPGDKLFTLSATPHPTVPKSVTDKAMETLLMDFLTTAQQAGIPPTEEEARRFGETRIEEIMNAERETARDEVARLERFVHDTFVEAEFPEVFALFVDYLTVYGTAFIEGPLPVTEYVNEYADDDDTRKPRIRRVLRRRLKFRAVNPLSVYPSRDQVGVVDGNICIRTEIPVHDLWVCSRKASGSTDAADGRWFRDTIDTILAIHPTGGLALDDADIDGESENRLLRGQAAWRSTDSCMMEGITFYGKTRGNLLLHMGVEKDTAGKRIDPESYYEIHAIVIDNQVVYLRMSDPCIGRTLCRGVFYSKVDSFWGTSIAERLDTVQREMNSCLKAILSNMVITALPIFWLRDAGSLLDKSKNALRMQAGKVVAFTRSVLGQNGVPIGALNVPSMIEQFLRLYEFNIRRADDVSGIPAYTYGNTQQTGGAARTYAGLSMLTEAANRGMRVVINSVDRSVIRALVKRTCDYLMLHDRDCPYHGDVNVNPSGVMSLILRENERQKTLQFMDMVTKNPALSQIVGPTGLVEIFRQVIHAYDIDNEDKIIPSKAEIEMQKAFAQMKALAQIDQLQAQAAATQAGAPQDAAAAQAGSPEAAPTEEPSAVLSQTSPTQSQIDLPTPQQPRHPMPAPGSANERRGAA